MKIYLSKKNYLIHKEFAKLLYDSNENEGIKASQIIANWVTDVFETKGKNALDYEKEFHKKMSTASKGLKEKVNLIFKETGVSDRI